MAALKTTAVPLNRITLEEWRTEGGSWIGTDYTSMGPAEKAMFDRLVNESHEFLSQRGAHEPWGKRETTLTVSAGTDTTYSMPEDFRHLVDMRESSSSRILTIHHTTKRDYYKSADGSSEEPWASSLFPYWFFDGFTDDEPPVQQWRRIGVDNAGATVNVLYRPFYPILTIAGGGQDRFTDVPASEVAATREHFRYKWALYKKDFEEAAVYRQAREDEIDAIEVNDKVETETPWRLGGDPDYNRYMNLGL